MGAGAGRGKSGIPGRRRFEAFEMDMVIYALVEDSNNDTTKNQNSNTAGKRSLHC